jgi:NAD(P)-dependent dehydrogenase (short-subunit alcohol dehydrogenase family)
MPVRTMSGKTCLVTGATSGIGMETALRLAMLGATVIIVARDTARGAAAGEEIRRRVPLALARYDRLDVLVNNAGVISMRRQLTADGLETTFATNHLLRGRCRTA